MNKEATGAEKAAEASGALPMRVVLISKTGETWSVWLPPAVSGHYKFQDNNGIDAELPFYIEPANNRWVASCGHAATFRQENASGIDRILGHEVVLTDKMLVRINYKAERYLLYAEAEHPGDGIFIPYYFEEKSDYSIGRREDCDLFYPNITVSRNHAKLHWQDGAWHIIDQFSTNGVYVNGRAVETSQRLYNGDCIFIMGLYILVGVGFFSINNANNRVRINTPKIRRIMSKADIAYAPRPKSVPDMALFDRQPRKMIKVEPEPIEIDMPPMSMNANKIPLLLRLGSPMVMGGRAIATGNYLMALSSLVFPALTQGLTEKDRKDYEAKRTERYRAYLKDKEKEIAEEKRREEQLLNENYPALSSVIRFPATKQRLWERRTRDDDFLYIRFGTGEIPLIAEKTYSKRKFEMEPDPLMEEMYELAEKPVLLNSAPVMLSLREDRFIGILGTEQASSALLRSLILQIASTHSYDELKLIVLVDKENAQELDFVRYLPHCWDDERTIRFFAVEQTEVQPIGAYLSQELEDIIAADDPVRLLKDRLRYVVIAQSKRLFSSMEVMKLILQHEKYCGVSVIAAFEGLPKECSRIIDLRSEPQIIDLTHPEEKNQSFRLDEYYPDRIKNGIQALMCTKLKTSSQLFSLPSTFTFLEMFNVGRVEQLNPMKRWADHNPVKSLSTPVGIATDGRLFTLDLHEKRQGPHGLVAGMTGSGKSEFIITYILSMAVNYSPDEVAFILIDYKGGGLADAFENKTRGIHLPHLAGTITNLDGAAIQRSLMSINSELKRRQTVFKEAKSLIGEGTMDIYDYQKLYRAGRVKEPLPHLFIISDEFAELKAQQPEFMDELISAARIGRSLGVHLILATQKPSGVVNNQIWSNTKFRICLKVQDRSDSMEMLKRPEAAELKETGRFYLQVGYNEYFALGQSAWCGADYIPQNEVVVPKDESIQFLDRVGRDILTLKPKSATQTQSEGKQIVAIVSYLSALAQRENIRTRRLWEDPIPAELDFDELSEKTCAPENARFPVLLGMVDDPERQTQYPFWLELANVHNMLLCGAAGSGKSTLLRTMLLYLVEHHGPQELQYYILDLSAGAMNPFRGMPHCGAYLTEADDGDIGRLFEFVMELVSQRKKLFLEADVTTYDAYIQSNPLPLILFIIDGYTNIRSLSRGQELFNSMQEYMRAGMNYGFCFVLSCNHNNEISSKVRQELDYRLALEAKDHFEYTDILALKCKLVPSALVGRGICVIEGRPLEYQTARPYTSETEQVSARRLKQRLNDAAASYTGHRSAARLPMIKSGQEYADFCTGFQTERLALGYSTRNMAAVLLPFQQFYSASVYFGNPLGVRPVLNNLVYAAGYNKADLILVKRQADSVIDGAFERTIQSSISGCVTLLDSSAEGVSKLNDMIYQEICARNIFRDEYSQMHGLPENDKGRAKKAAAYIRARTHPIFVILESFGDLCRTELDDVPRQELEAFLSRLQGYNIYFFACFYPNEEGNIQNSSLMRCFNKEELLLLFGGQYDKQCVTTLPMDYRRIEKINPKYDRYLLKYRGEYYTVHMPCGELSDGSEDPDEAPIIQ